MTEIRQSRFQTMLRQVFALTDKFAPTLLEDVMPVYPIEDPTEPHLQFSKDVRLLMGSQAVTPAVTDISAFTLQPVSLSVGTWILDVIGITFTNRDAATQEVAIYHVGGMTPLPVIDHFLSQMDGRYLGAGDAVSTNRAAFGFSAQIAGSIGIPAGNNVHRFFIPGRTSFFIPWKCVLHRSLLQFFSVAINVSIGVSVIALERLAEPPEQRRSSGPGSIGP
jgi:hypothetical protein